MKRNYLKKLALGVSLIMTASALSACGGSDTTEQSTTTGTDTETTAEAEVSESTGGDTLVVGYDQFSGKFSPFFATTAFDNDAMELTGLGLLESDREGNVVLNGIEGETIAYNGVDYTYNGISNCVITQNEDGTVNYEFTLRDDITFSDGTPLTADDAIFSMYVYSDPTYDGASTFYSMPITGMEEYRGGMQVKGDLIFAAGPDNTDFTYFTEEEQKAYWAAIPEAGEAFAQEIIDYCVTNYNSEIEAVGGSEVALGMYAWGFGTPSEDGSQITGAGTETVYDTATVTAADYWAEIEASYESNYQEISDVESANSSLFALLSELHPEFATGVSTGDSAANISGITKTSDYSFNVAMDSFDAAAIYKLAILVSPLHYYGDAATYDYDNNQFGFTKGDLSTIKSKTAQPLGAGPYVFDSYQNGVITYTANENYYKGEPKTKNLLLKETPAADKLTGVASGTFDISDPSMSLPTLESIKGYNSNGEITGDVVSTSLVDNLGYGYIGINSDTVKVGDNKESEESKNLRKGFATIFSVYRDTVINSYYGEMAAVIQYPISNTSWAAPRPADEGYEVAYSNDVDGNAIYTSDMTDEQKYEVALEATVGYFKAAGYTYDEASGKFTAAPSGAEMTYEVIIPAGGTGDHPAFGILTAAKESLASIGITLEINDPADSNVLWNKLDSGTHEMWTAAWSATADPDMYQIYHSSNISGLGGTDSNNYAIADAELDQLMVDARSSADQTYRKATYKECLDIVLDWGVEIPTYQRQNAVVFSAERVNMDTVTPEITTFWRWMKDIEKLEMN